MARSLSSWLLSMAALVAVPVLAPACAAPTEGGEDEVEASDDEIVATFDRSGKIDLNKTTRIMLIGDSSHLGELPLYSATTRARRYQQLYPNDQVVLFVTKDVKDARVSQAAATIVKDDANGGGLAVSDFSRLDATKLMNALDRFKRIAALEFFGHSSPFAALLEAEGDNRTLGNQPPANLGVLKDNFARDTNPYVTLNGCNGAANVAPLLSKVWELPVSGALTGSNFQELRSDGRWYFNDEGFFPENTSRATRNDKSFAPGVTPSCGAGACVRMKPQDSPYRGVWASSDTGFQYGAGYYKFFCDYTDPQNTCAKGMAASLYAFASIKSIDKRASDADVKEVLADFFCNGSKDPTWFDTCRTNLFAAVTANSAFSPMRTANDYTHECNFKSCEQKLRCKNDPATNSPKKGTCVWVSAACRDDQSASSSACKPKNTKKQMTNIEFAKYLEGHRLLRGN